MLTLGFVSFLPITVLDSVCQVRKKTRFSFVRQQPLSGLAFQTAEYLSLTPLNCKAGMLVYNKAMAKEKGTCDWPGNDPLMRQYHDTEWGKPVRDDRKIFEFLVLESAQAGLSWRTVLYKREGYRRLFADFDAAKVAKFDEKRMEKMLKDPAIIRNRQKVSAAINNAKRFLEIQKEFGSFSKYMWRFVDNKEIDGKRKKLKDLPAVTKEAEVFAADLKKRGFKFMGPTVVYAHMQAVGMANDHLVSCFRHAKCLKVRRNK